MLNLCYQILLVKVLETLCHITLLGVHKLFEEHVLFQDLLVLRSDKVAFVFLIM